MSVGRLENEDYIFSRSRTLLFYAHELLKYCAVIQPLSSFQKTIKNKFPGVKYPEEGVFDPQSDKVAVQILLGLNQRYDVPRLKIRGRYINGDYAPIQIEMQKEDTRTHKIRPYLTVGVPQDRDDIYRSSVRLAGMATVRSFAELLNSHHFNDYKYLLECLRRLHDNYAISDFLIREDEYEKGNYR